MDDVLPWPRLRDGDLVRMVSPASPPQHEGWRPWAAGLLGQWGLDVDFGRHADDRYGEMAGRDDDRLADLEDAFRDPAVRAIIATRGGTGAQRIASRIDPALVRADPKPIVGFSDITYLHLALLGRTGLTGIHGSLDAVGCRQLLFTGEPAVLRAAPSATTVPGVATGRLIGGYTSAVAAMIGAGLPSLAGAVLCLEGPGSGEVLRRPGLLEGVRGVALGDLAGEAPPDLSALGVPVLAGLPFGHLDDPVCMPLGTTATIDTEAGTLTVSAGTSAPPRSR
ncbi:LD-carboxypeptidase [Actinoplanes sp. NPDC000266]